MKTTNAQEKGAHFDMQKKCAKITTKIGVIWENNAQITIQKENVITGPRDTVIKEITVHSDMLKCARTTTKTGVTWENIVQTTIH